MSLLDVSNLSFGYAGDALFDGVTFRLNAGERAGLVAPNGAGKSTLLRLIAGELAPDRGSVTLEKNRSFAYYRQSHEHGRAGTALEILLSGFGDIVELERELALAQKAAESGAEEDLERLSRAMDRHHAAGAEALEHKVQTIASRLGFPETSLGRAVESLSGGERGRLELGAVLAREPDLLLLDEPTNHLDLGTIDWLASEILARNAAALVVSHDRAFLDAVCPMTFELGRTRFRNYSLPFTAYQAARAEDLERERKLAEEQAAFVAKTEEFIRKNIAGQKTKQAQSRRRMLEKLDRTERPEDVWARAERVRFRFADAPRTGDIVLDAKGLGASRSGRQLFGGVDLLVRRGEKLGIVGPNGSGKTTLLRLLAGNGAADDVGTVRRGTNLREGYFDQHLGTLNPQNSGIEEIRAVRGDLTVEAVREYLARFRFWGDDPFRKVASLSGGERSRLALGKLLLEPRNLLFLDEPTNHLDIFAAEILEEALAGFDGTVILVSHDRRFLENVTSRVVAFSPGGVDVFEAGFADYEKTLLPHPAARSTDDGRTEGAAAQRREQRTAMKSQSASTGNPKATVPGKANDGASEYRERQAVIRELEKKKRRAEKLESDIAEGEAELAALRERLRQAPGDDWEKLHDLSRQEQVLSRRIDAMMSDWERLSEELAKQDMAQGSAASEAR